MMVALLANATGMQVMQPQDGMVVQLNHVYLITPWLYLGMAQGWLNLTVPLVRLGMRLPFDFLLQSLALSVGANAACVILSGQDVLVEPPFCKLSMVSCFNLLIYLQTAS